ncbi:hypothetical protein HK100_004294 [Physocladia obscura]|uniref:DUF5745 domain-containing protein n=1 Tax=Physocladia obscura TaxID=109957 RepID=A0AAD5XD27_9FUNG|nr:hypothetical protein HK100_004294 [Physocladia obscura]
MSTNDRAVAMANRLLGQIGVSVRVQHVRECVSSLFVALFEGLLRVRLPGIIRNTSDRATKINNIQVVVMAMETEVLAKHGSLAHIDPACVVDGYEDTLCNLLALFTDLADALESSTNNPQSLAPTDANTTPSAKNKRNQTVAFAESHNYLSKSSDEELSQFSFKSSATDFTSLLQQVLPAQTSFSAAPLSSASSPSRFSDDSLISKWKKNFVDSASVFDYSSDNFPVDSRNQVEKKASRNEETASKNRPEKSVKRGIAAVRDRNFLTVVDDVEHYILAESRKNQDKALNSGIKYAVDSLKNNSNKKIAESKEEDLSLLFSHTQSEEIDQSLSNLQNRANSKIHSNLNKLKNRPITPRSSVPTNVLKIEPSDTPHTRALKLRQQRLIQARKEAIARMNTASKFVRKSLNDVHRSSKHPTTTAPSLPQHAQKKQKSSTSTKTKPHMTQIRQTQQIRSGAFTRAASLTEALARSEGSRWWDGKEIFKLSAKNRDGNFDINNSNENADDATDESSVFSPPLDSYGEFGGAKDGPSGEFLSEQISFGNSDYWKEESSGSSPLKNSLLDSQGKNKISSESNRQRNIRGEKYSDENNSTAGYEIPMSVTEQNFVKFESIVKKELRIKKVPDELKTKTWNGQVRDHKRALNTRLHERRRHLHREMSTFGDLRPIQVLRKDIEQTFLQKQAFKEREAQRQAKIALADQKRRVVKMEQRLHNAEADVENILQKREIKEAELAEHLYDTYLSTQRQIVREVSRFDRDRRKAQQDAEKVKLESKETFARDQIRLLEEDLKRAKWEEELVSKAHAEEMRKLIREQKNSAREKIRIVKSKLLVDGNDFELQRTAAGNVLKNLKFGMKKI